jgi:hypothetical protein
MIPIVSIAMLYLLASNNFSTQLIFRTIYDQYNITIKPLNKKYDLSEHVYNENIPYQTWLSHTHCSNQPIIRGSTHLFLIIKI